MKIYTRIEINMETMAVMHEESFEYDGIVSLCGGGSGGGSSTTNTVDYAYNSRMATLSEQDFLTATLDVYIHAMSARGIQ